MKTYLVIVNHLGKLTAIDRDLIKLIDAQFTEGTRQYVAISLQTGDFVRCSADEKMTDILDALQNQESAVVYTKPALQLQMESLKGLTNDTKQA